MARLSKKHIFFADEMTERRWWFLLAVVHDGKAESTPGHSHASCTDGQRLSAYEQNTQQSPDFGRSTVWHRSHS